MCFRISSSSVIHFVPLLLYVLYFTVPFDSVFFFFLMIRRPPRSTLDRSSAASDVYKRQVTEHAVRDEADGDRTQAGRDQSDEEDVDGSHEGAHLVLSLIHISEPTRPY